MFATNQTHFKTEVHATNLITEGHAKSQSQRDIFINVGSASLTFRIGLLRLIEFTK